MFQPWEPERVTTIADVLELEWYAGDTMVAFVLSKMSSEILQNWSEVALDVLKNWPPEKPYLALYDLSHRGVVIGYLDLVQRRMLSLGITEAGEERALDIIAQREGFSARVALYASMTRSGYVGRLFAKMDARRSRFGKVAKHDVFYDREAAFDWLKETYI